MTIANEIHEVADGLWSWHAYDDNVRTDLFSTALRTQDGLVVIDPILLVPDLMNKLSRMGPFAAIVLTNGNHARAVRVFRESLSAPVFAHPDAVGELTSPVDGTLRVNRKLGGSLEVIELPGAGPGEVALLSDRGTLHFGDAVIRTEKGIEALPAKYCEDPARLAEGLKKLREKDFALVTFAHGLPIVENARELLGPVLG